MGNPISVKSRCWDSDIEGRGKQMKESAIEARLVRRVRERGGLCYKFVSPGNRGVPDRLVIAPDGRVFFVELKSKNGRLSELQKFQKSELEKRNMAVQVLYSVEQVEEFVKDAFKPNAGSLCDDCEYGKERGCYQAHGIFYDPWGEGLSKPDWCPYQQSNGLDDDPLPF